MTDALVVLDDERHADGERSGRSGWLRRALVAGDVGRRGSVAWWLAALGAAAFLASLLLDWQSITVPNQPENGFGGDDPTGENTFGFGVGDQSSFGLVYLFGMVGLLAVTGALLNRSEAAARLRLGAVGAAVGILAVLVALTERLDETVVGVPMAMQVIYGGAVGVDDRYQIAYGPGVFAAYAAVLLPTVAIWLSARAGAPASGARFTRHRAVVAPEPADEEPADVVGPAALPEYQRRHNDGPLDLTVTPG